MSETTAFEKGRQSGIVATLCLRLERAESNLAALRERMRWRDVLVELPDDHEDVPVVARDSTGKLYPTFAYKLTGVDGDVRWFNNGYQLDNVTRWQPMPAAPEVPQ